MGEYSNQHWLTKTKSSTTRNNFIFIFNNKMVCPFSYHPWHWCHPPSSSPVWSNDPTKAKLMNQPRPSMLDEALEDGYGLAWKFFLCNKQKGPGKIDAMLTVAVGEMQCRTKTQAMNVYIDNHIICKCGTCVKKWYDYIICIYLYLYINIQVIIACTATGVLMRCKP